MSTFWIDRPTLVTGATGLVGGWVVKRLLRAQADIVCLVRDWVPESDFVRSGLLGQVKTVRGDVCDQPLLERVLGQSLSAAKAREKLDWGPLFSLEDGLRKTISWYSDTIAMRKAA